MITIKITNPYDNVERLASIGMPKSGQEKRREKRRRKRAPQR